MAGSTSILIVLVLTVPALARAQVRTDVSPTIPACPTSGPGTEVSLGADSLSRRPPPTDSTNARNRATGQRIGTAPDIILRASVSAREVRFASQPHLSVRLCGGTLDSVHVLERRNLPSPVVPGTTYRDVYVAVEILGHLTGSCIANGLTGGRAAPGASGLCASLGIRDTAGAQRAPPRRPQ